MHRIVLAGSVNSSMATLKKLVEHQAGIVGVFGYEPDDTFNISGYVNMQDYCNAQDIRYTPFKKINSDAVKNTLTELKPDIFFVVGLSQLVSSDILSIAKLGNIGFHPTLLPKGRGRAPIAWLVLEEESGAANFFLMGEGTDDGPVFVQKAFKVTNEDNAATIEKKILEAINVALDEWLPQLNANIWQPIPQDESLASYYGKRTPADGCIDWSASASDIDKLIRASAFPHPGAFSFINDQKLAIQGSKLETDLKIKGVVGSVLLNRGEEFLIQTGDGQIWISDIANLDGNYRLKVGDKLGYYSDIEIYQLKKELKLIKQKLGI